MSRHRSDELSSDGRLIEDNQGVARPKYRSPSLNESSITSAVLGAQRLIVERSPICLDHYPLLDHEIHPSNALHPNLRANSETQLPRDHPDDGFKARFRAAVDEVQKLGCRRREPGPQLSKLTRMKGSDVYRTVDASDPCAMVEASECLNQRADERNVDAITVARRMTVPMPMHRLTGAAEP